VFFAATQKSLAVGLPMGYLLFGQDNPQLFAILLPLILFHPLQLLLGAALCSLLPKNSERSNS
jgi:sodium/bile acid cotransporter 7